MRLKNSCSGQERHCVAPQGVEFAKDEGEVTRDDFLEGALRIWQPTGGLRANVDTVLLGAFAHARRYDRILDMGCSFGAVALQLAWRFPHISVVGLDIQDDLVALAERNAQENAVSDRVSFLVGDLRKMRQYFAPESFHVVVTNPPYGDGALSRPSPRLGMAVACHDLCCSLHEMARAAAFVLPSGGHLYTVFRAGRVAELCDALRLVRLEPKRLIPVYPKEGRDASVVLVGAVKGARAGLRFEVPLVIQGQDGQSTAALRRAYTREGLQCP